MKERELGSEVIINEHARNLGRLDAEAASKREIGVIVPDSKDEDDEDEQRA